ncbi:hypothetical protein B0J15DRAFT_516385 [Fusarium solani]|uniref:S-adenosyl-L-methionine-dependent methyltransferase n=1 Tax=Fusarium solani TaxID=169388 RepID=A0A9P9K0K3_FUSSL|nr:uncharacterized protein B0J15DRAFT_516385 [Fusarium solani]KAH7239831.1 hypothetical protein B0J15DRAFT_516385 [Fusarium solani]
MVVDQVESTASITSSILEDRNIHGRTYQSSKTTEYCDEKHVEGFDVGHHWITMLLDDKLYLPPIRDNPQARLIRILDVGTGSGIWAIFQIDDAQLNWTFEPESFDFIHIRSLHGAIDDWPKLYGQLFKFLKPGGWFQHMEPGIALRCDNPAIKYANFGSVFKQWAQLFYDAGDRLGRTFDITDTKMENWAREAGFTKIAPKTFKLPYGLGGFATYPMSQILGWSLEEITVLVGQMRAAINDQKNFPNGDMYVFLMQNFACLLTISIGMSPTARSYCREWACG